MTPEETVLLLSILILCISAFSLNLLNKLSSLKEQLETTHDMIISMAEELQSLGSPNVKVIKREE